MAEKNSLKKRVFWFFVRLREKVHCIKIFTSLDSQFKSWTIDAERQEKHRRQLVLEVDRCLRWHARCSTSDIQIWALAMASVRDGSKLPIGPKAKALAIVAPTVLQNAAAEVLSRRQFRTELFLEVVKNRDNLFLILSSPSQAAGGALVPSTYLRAAKMHCPRFWIALCRQVISDSARADRQYTYEVPGQNKQIVWNFSNDVDSWKELMQYLIDKK